MSKEDEERARREAAKKEADRVRADLARVRADDQKRLDTAAIKAADAHAARERAKGNKNWQGGAGDTKGRKK